MKFELRDLLHLAGVGLAAAVLSYACDNPEIRHKTNNEQVGAVEKDSFFNGRKCSLKLNEGITIVYMSNEKGYSPDEVRFYVNDILMPVEEGESFKCDSMNRYDVSVVPKKSPDLGALIREDN